MRAAYGRAFTATTLHVWTDTQQTMAAACKVSDDGSTNSACSSYSRCQGIMPGAEDGVYFDV